MSEKRVVFKSVTVEPECQASSLAQKFPEAQVVKGAPQLGFYREGKHRLHISSKTPNAFHRCSSLNYEYLCCNVHVLRTMSNCPFDCSYCFLQNYLTNGTTMVVADIPSLIGKVKAKQLKEPWRFLRVGTWELADSLALESELGTAGRLLEAFKELNNAVLELKTKSAVVDGLLPLDHGGRTIISWSMNPDGVITAEEHGTASLDERLDAMKKVCQAGYPIAIHFDPMIYHEGWESAYEVLVKRIFSAVPKGRITWISIGVLRFNPEMKRKVEDHFPKSKITAAEMVLGKDGKVRYVKPLRLKMLSHLYRLIRAYGGEEPYVYLCMERPDIWQRVMGWAPRSIAHQDYLIADSLYRRFPEFFSHKPSYDEYEKIGEVEQQDKDKSPSF